MVAWSLPMILNFALHDILYSDMGAIASSGSQLVMRKQSKHESSAQHDVAPLQKN